MRAILYAFVTVVLLQPGAAVERQDHFFDSNGVRLRYIEQGQGPAIVLMHGYTGNADRHFVANGVFANLAKDYRTIASDLRGHGKSGKPHDAAAYGEEMARDVVRLLDHLKIPRAHVVGYSLGAMIAARLVTMDPERVISVVYVASLPWREGTSYMEKMAQDSAKELESDLPFRSLVAAVAPAGAPPPSDAEMREAMAPLVAANDVKALAALWRGSTTMPVTDAKLAAVKVPSIAIIGSEDISAAGVPELNKTHPQIRTVVVQGAQHGGAEGVMRRPEFLPTLREFLAAAR